MADHTALLVVDSQKGAIEEGNVIVLITSKAIAICTPQATQHDKF